MKIGREQNEIKSKRISNKYSLHFGGILIECSSILSADFMIMFATNVGRCYTLFPFA